ncbi:hypothetical protein PoB_005869700 [Plakobranchus ocellatus]|uniref:Uncharacterized protein n=1 Tax=Plakobranchus ocellatus TaxID=259542 RepID=A0AAV4CL40_9GAST|nr:hypothetical protein PoB_005869700 [Plakobranchus ocellatus]
MEHKEKYGDGNVHQPHLSDSESDSSTLGLDETGEDQTITPVKGPVREEDQHREKKVLESSVENCRQDDLYNGLKIERELICIEERDSEAIHRKNSAQTPPEEENSEQGESLLEEISPSHVRRANTTERGVNSDMAEEEEAGGEYVVIIQTQKRYQKKIQDCAANSRSNGISRDVPREMKTRDDDLQVSEGSNEVCDASRESGADSTSVSIVNTKASDSRVNSECSAAGQTLLHPDL